MKHDLCPGCAYALRESYDLKQLPGPTPAKIICAHCGKRTYGAHYELTKKGAKPK